MSRALGGAVASAMRTEIRLDRCCCIATTPRSYPVQFGFHYHDRWTVPAGAREIARTASASQAFTHGRNNIAVPSRTHCREPGGLVERRRRRKVTADGQDPDVMLSRTRCRGVVCPGSHHRSSTLTSGGSRVAART
jgi:hypothetical protein